MARGASAGAQCVCCCCDTLACRGQEAGDAGGVQEWKATGRGAREEDRREEEEEEGHVAQRGGGISVTHRDDASKPRGQGT
jgi:hypothetical protein